MNFKNFTPTQIQRAVARANKEYAGNLDFVTTYSDETRAGWRIRGVLRTHNSSGHGSRTAASGRRGPYASWEAHRDFMVQLFLQNPDGHIQSYMEHYKSLNDFLANHAATAHRLTGSSMDPRTFRALTVIRG